MIGQDDTFFSWTARRVVLATYLPPAAEPPRDRPVGVERGLTLDVAVTVGHKAGRLIAYRDPDEDVEHTALLIGIVTGARDVPVRVVDEEALLVEGGRTTSAPEILVGAHDDTMRTGSHNLGRREVDTQLCMGGPVRELLMRSGAVSVDIDWCGHSLRRWQAAKGRRSPNPSSSSHLDSAAWPPDRWIPAM